MNVSRTCACMLMYAGGMFGCRTAILPEIQCVPFRFQRTSPVIFTHHCSYHIMCMARAYRAFLSYSYVFPSVSRICARSTPVPARKKATFVVSPSKSTTLLMFSVGVREREPSTRAQWYPKEHTLSHSVFPFSLPLENRRLHTDIFGTLSICESERERKHLTKPNQRTNVITPGNKM